MGGVQSQSGFISGVVQRLNVTDIKRDDLLLFKTYLKKQEFSGRTIYNHFLNARSF
jgi:hypothetical protein